MSQSKDLTIHAITVGQLLSALQKEDLARIVILSSDAEGNSHSPLASWWTGSYAPDSTYSGEVGLEVLTDEDEERGYTDEDVIDGVPALILTPTN